jgi:hypothetical protein
MTSQAGSCRDTTAASKQPKNAERTLFVSTDTADYMLPALGVPATDRCIWTTIATAREKSRPPLA